MSDPSKSASVLLCTGSYDRTIRFWEALNGICNRTIQHPDSVNRLCLSSDKQYLAAAGNPHTRIYEAMGSHPNPIASLEGHTANVTSVQFHLQNKWLCTVSEDGTLRVWDLRTRKSQRDYAHKCPINDVLIHPNQMELISCDQNGSIKVPEEESPMRSVSMANDGSLLCAGNNRGNVYIWRMLPTQSAQSMMTGSGGGSQGEVLWDLQPVTKIHAHSKYLLRSMLSPDARLLATCSADSTIKIWRLDNAVKEGTNGVAQLDRILTGHQRWVWDCAFSADSEYLVSVSSDHTARLWDLSTGETIRQYQGHHKSAVCVALNDFNLS